jgi:hypothetical protein
MKNLKWITCIGTIGLTMIVAGLVFANEGLVNGGQYRAQFGSDCDRHTGSGPEIISSKTLIQQFPSKVSATLSG